MNTLVSTTQNVTSHNKNLYYDHFDIFAAYLTRSYISLKEYYEIVDEARPLSGFFPTHADFITEMHF